ncbi:GH11985 [Drosophila grimshawi]|uniref:GH11985 n=1 Tax=Drosophila grimshawi TaxID=7222 RepID=B4JKV3_DROGR|nr:GH11985 [Drosophila grimshawi]
MKRVQQCKQQHCGTIVQNELQLYKMQEREKAISQADYFNPRKQIAMIVIPKSTECTMMMRTTSMENGISSGVFCRKIDNLLKRSQHINQKLIYNMQHYC